MYTNAITKNIKISTKNNTCPLIVENERMIERIIFKTEVARLLDRVHLTQDERPH